MKKLLLITSLLAVFSCTHQNQQVNLVVYLDEAKARNVSKTVDVVVIDKRQNKEIVGIKKFGEEKINITSDQDLGVFVQKKIREGLEARGFKSGKDKLVEVQIENFKYKAKRGFPLGKSKAEVSIKVVVKNSRSGEKFTKNFDLEVKNKHFIVSWKETDDKNINNAIEDALQNILNDEALLKTLAE